MGFTEALAAFFVKYGIIIASLVGSLLSLSLLRPLSKKEACASIALGFCTAIFTTDLVVAYFGLPVYGDSKNGVAYLIGLTSMNLVPLLKLSLRELAKFIIRKGMPGDM